MSGGAMPEQGGGHGGKKKKSLDANINVVPAIDLLSCCISFLLFTAVWTQISRLQVQQLGTGAPAEPAQLEPQKALAVMLSVGERGMSLVVGEATFEIPTLGRTAEGTVTQDLKSLAVRLKALKGNYPDQASIIVSAEDTVPYGDLVHVIDACMAAGLPQISVTGG
jgi:biopolymer transport protein TolR